VYVNESINLINDCFTLLQLQFAPKKDIFKKIITTNIFCTKLYIPTLERRMLSRNAIDLSKINILFGRINHTRPNGTSLLNSIFYFHRCPDTYTTVGTVNFAFYVISLFLSTLYPFCTNIFFLILDK